MLLNVQSQAQNLVTLRKKKSATWVQQHKDRPRWHKFSTRSSVIPVWGQGYRGECAEVRGQSSGVLSTTEFQGSNSGPQTWQCHLRIISDEARLLGMMTLFFFPSFLIWRHGSLCGPVVLDLDLKTIPSCGGGIVNTSTERRPRQVDFSKSEASQN